MDLSNLYVGLGRASPGTYVTIIFGWSAIELDHVRFERSI